jgi:hypothetical protein
MAKWRRFWHISQHFRTLFCPLDDACPLLLVSFERITTQILRGGIKPKKPMQNTLHGLLY